MKIFIPTAADCKLVTIYDSCIHAFRQHNANASLSWVLDPESADLIILFEEWGTRFWHYSQVLAEDPFFMRHWSRIFTINCDDLGRGFVPGCYTSLNRGNLDRRLHRACAYPYCYNELVSVSSRTQNDNAKWLFSFRGTEKSHPIRRKLFDLFSKDPQANMARVETQFHAHSATQKQEYVNDILSSMFVLCPRGWSPTTYRMFEVMELGRCPVIISDDWVPPDGVPWQECSILIKEKDVSYCAEILRQEESNYQRLGKAAREIWEKHFSESRKFQKMLHSLLELKAQRGTDCEDYRERWSSWRFRYVNGWLPHQRIAKRLMRSLSFH